MFFDQPHCIFEPFVATGLAARLRLRRPDAETREFEAETRKRPGPFESPNSPGRLRVSASSLKFTASIFFAILLFAVGRAEDAPLKEATTRTSAPAPEQIKLWISRLESDSYSTRKLAYQMLQVHPVAAMPFVEAAVSTAQEDAAHRLIRLLGGWSFYPDEGYGREAFAALSRIAAGRVSTRAGFAKGIIAGIAEDQSEHSEEFIGRLSGFVGYEPMQLFALQNRGDNNYYVLRLDEAFRGSSEDLRCLRWLKSVEAVRLEGKRIDTSWLEKVVQLPNLRILQIRQTSINGRDMDLLHQLERLEWLEIMYSPIDDEAVDSLAGLPLAGKIRLFGTKMSEEGVERLRAGLDGSEITFGRGGFLGIGTQSVAGQPQSLVLSQITPGSGAENAGLRIGDRITKIDGKELANFDELRAELAKHAPGEVVTITYVREWFSQENDPKDDERKPFDEVQVVLGEQP